MTAVIQAQMQQGLISDCKIQDLRDIDVSILIEQKKTCQGSYRIIVVGCRKDLGE